LFGIALIVALGGTALVLMGRESRIVEGELEARSRLLATTLLTSAAAAILTEDLGNIDAIRGGIERREPDVVYLCLWNRHGKPLTRNRNFREGGGAALRMRYVLETGRPTQRWVQAGGMPALETYYPLRIGGHTYAVLCAGYSLEGLLKRDRQIVVQSAAIFVSAFLFSIIIITIFTGILTRPLHQLTALAGRVAKGELDVVADVRGRDEVGQLGRAFNDMVRGLRERQFIKDTFSRYVTHQVAEELLRNPDSVALGGVKQEVTVLFSDIRSFTLLSERLSPEEVVSHLNEYFSAMIDIIFKYEGTLDKFVGDAIMAVFGAPIAHPDDPERAVRTAMEMQERLRTLNEKWRSENREQISIGVGINTGEAIAGNIGDIRRMEYTVIGFHVNLASRMENLTKKYGLSIVISENTYKHVKHLIEARMLPEPVEVKGNTMPFQVYEVIGWKK
jgi:adenylate cyclase